MLLILRSLYEKVFPASVESGQAQSSSISAGISYDASISSGQAQSSSVDAGIAYQAVVSTGQAQSSEAAAFQQVSATLSSGQAQSSSVSLTIIAPVAVVISTGQAAQSTTVIVTAPTVVDISTSQASSSSISAAIVYASTVQTEQAQSVFLDGLLAIQSDGEDGAVIIEVPKRDARWLG
jgi:hypothetical protein